MLTPEETKILKCLRQRVVVTRAELCKACGASQEWISRALADLEWLGYVVVFYDGAGSPVTVQTTERGRACTV